MKPQTAGHIVGAVRPVTRQPGQRRVLCHPLYGLDATPILKMILNVRTVAGLNALIVYQWKKEATLSNYSANRIKVFSFSGLS